MPSCGEAILPLLESYGVDTVFGIPGVHTVEMYRGFRASRIQHITPRHEQGAGFMADGYARATGRPGVCLLITGPGVTNAATALAQAFSDSVPVLAISSVNRSNELGLGRGLLHELPSQRNLMAQCTAFSHTLLAADQLPDVLTQAFSVFASRRPRPVHIEIPIDVLESPMQSTKVTVPTVSRPAPDSVVVAQAGKMLNAASNPVVILGGGTVTAAIQARTLVELLDAPTVLTVAAKGVLPDRHPLCVGAHLPYRPVQDLIDQADVVLAVGTELADTDMWRDGRPLEISGQLIRVDIDPQQLTKNARPALTLLSDASAALEALHQALGQSEEKHKRSSGAERVAKVRVAIPQHWLAGTERQVQVLDALREVLPDNGMVTADCTQLVYSGNSYFPVNNPRSWLTSTTGYGTLGYALPAAIGAKIGAPQRSVVCIAGDGGFLFTIAELAVAVEQKLPIAIVVWHNDGYGEIRDYMNERQIPEVGVNLRAPDFITVAEGFGCIAARVQSLDHFKELLKASFAQSVPTLIEIRQDAEFLC
ncbi:MAG: 5-guanidino-2-oxopentanoate decarboxylase [Gammaproteobacteria bacterium]|nr:5-guanidino-2-oxopentanoate decarboxylase [Gammaproteobacteria bacterium]